MKRLIFEVISHGVHTPDTFLGCGVQCTPYDQVVTGSGSSEHEAACDAQEILLQRVGGEGVTIMDLMVLEGRIANLPVAEDAHDNCGCMDKTMETADEFCEAAYYVSIRWRLE